MKLASSIAHSIHLGTPHLAPRVLSRYPEYARCLARNAKEMASGASKNLGQQAYNKFKPTK